MEFLSATALRPGDVEASEVAADVDPVAHRAGVRSMPGWWATAGIVPGAVAQPAGSMVLMALLLAENLPVDALGINCTTAVAGSSHRGLIYASGANHQPGVKLADVAFDTAAAGLKTTAIPRLVLPRGIVWIGGLSIGGAPGITYVGGNQFLPVSPSQMSTGYAGALITGGGLMLVAPDPAPAMTYANNAPRLQLRMVA